MVSVAAGEVSTRVWLADANMPLLPVDSNFPHVYRDITVGTKPTIIVDSNVAEDWSGSLAIADANMDYGVLSARDYDGFGYPGSCLSAAGEGAAVYDWEEAGDYPLNWRYEILLARFGLKMYKSCTGASLMPKRLTISLKPRHAMQVTRLSIGKKKLVYAILVKKALKYKWAHSPEWFEPPPNVPWDAIRADISPDRFGTRHSKDNTSGSTLFLYADGRVESIKAPEIKAMADAYDNFAEPPH